MITSNSTQLSAYTLLTALGKGKAAHLKAIFEKRSGLRHCDFAKIKLDTYIGRVADIEAYPLPDEFSEYESRNNRLAFQGLHTDDFYEKLKTAITCYGNKRIGLVYGTTTSGFLQAESAYQNRDSNGALPEDFNYFKTTHPFATPAFLRDYLKLQGPAFTVATACSSSAKAFVHADRLLKANFCDAVLVAGVDSLCANILYGFNSLDILDNKACQPADQNRAGLSLGEAAAFALLERSTNDSIQLLGYGESSDAHHMSAPHPESIGATMAMQQALQMAGITPQIIDYINLHGTASQLNDKLENEAIFKLFSNTVASSSTKGFTGHTLGAAGAVEIVLSALCIEHGVKPCSLNTTQIDENCRSHILLENEIGPVNIVLNNSFGFGGNNCSVILGRKGKNKCN